jgi:Bacterial membrane protein YfhO
LRWLKTTTLAVTNRAGPWVRPIFAGCYHEPSVQVSEQQSVSHSRWRRWRVALSGPALLFVIYVGFFWKLTLTRQFTWMETPDIANQVLPWFQFQAGEWHKWHFPAWDPFEWGGQALVGQTQPGAVYPPNWLLFLTPLRDGWLRLSVLHWYFVLIHYMGGLFCYLLCRDLKHSRAASLLAGTAFGVTGWMGATEWPQMLNGAVWAPLVFLFLLRVVRGERTVVSGALAGTFLGVAFLSGHHQIPVFTTVAAGGVWLYCILSRRGDRKAVLEAAALFGVFLILVSAAQMIPAYEYGKLSSRWVGANEPVGWNTPVPYTVHSNFSLYPSMLVGMVLPSIARNANAYVTLTIVILALLAVAAGWRDRMVRIMSAVALGGLVCAMGPYALVHGVIYSVVPMVEKARSTGFFIFIFHFGVIVLSAYAVDAYMTIHELWISRAIWTILLVSAAVFSMELILNMTQVLKALDYDRLAGAAFYSLLLAALLFAWRRGHISHNHAAGLVILLFTLQAALETGFAWHHRERPSEFLKKMSDNSDIVQFIRHYPRFVRLELDDQEIPYNFNDWYGVDTLNGYLASLTDSIGRIQADYRVRMVLGVNLWLGKKPSRDNQQEVFTGSSGLKLYMNPEAYPQTWVVHEAVQIPKEKVLEAFQKYDLEQMRRLTFLRNATAPVLDKCGGPDWSEVVDRETSSVVIDAQLACTGMVILNDAYYPGWAASVDGKPAQLYETYGVIRGVVVPAGRHRIEMRYRPKSVYLGGAMTGLGLLAACVLAARSGRV